jgi:hypothetical protein
MKNSMALWKYAFLLGIVLGGLLISCGKDDTGGEGPGSTLVIDTLYVPADARIQSDAPDATFGIDDELTVALISYAGEYHVENRVFIRLPELPDGITADTLERAILILQYKGDELTRSVPVSAYVVRQIWTEAAVTWNSQPEADSVAFTSATVANKQLRIDVRSLYQLPESEQQGLLLRTRDGMEQRFYSRETVAQGTEPIIEYSYQKAL